MDTFNFAGTPTLERPAPRGYRLTERQRIIGAGRRHRGGSGADTAAAADAAFARAREAIFAWQIQRGSGFIGVQVPERVSPGAVSLFRIPFGPVRPAVRCRVFAVVDEPGRVGFGHGALEGHPQSGWESFIVDRRPDGSLALRIRVIARPAVWWMRLAGPFSQLALELLLRRNLRSLDAIVYP